MPTKKIPVKEMTVSELTTKATKSFERDSYSNHIQVAITPNELFVDFYYLSPSVSKTQPVVEHVQRVVVPVSLAKGLTTALANVIASYEAEHETVLANSREADPEDKITIWS